MGKGVQGKGVSGVGETTRLAKEGAGEGEVERRSVSLSVTKKVRGAGGEEGKTNTAEEVEALGKPGTKARL